MATRTTQPGRTEGSVRTVRAICCHCSTRCGVLVDVDVDGLPSAIRGDPRHPASKGFICPRGRAAAEYFHHPARLSRPLQRIGARGEGRWAEVGWDEALDEIAARLLAIRDESGPEAVAYLLGTFHGADANFAYRLMHHFGSPNSGGIGVICGGPRYLAESLCFGMGQTAPDIRAGLTRTVLLWSQHPSASQPTVWRTIREARQAGASLIVVDARPTTEARAADLWLQPRPGTDAALALGVLGVVLEEALWDRDFVGRWTTGFDALRDRLAEYPLERVERISGVPAEAIRLAARRYAGVDVAALSSGAPNGLGRNALNFERALAILIALTGNLDRPGGTRLPGPHTHGNRTSYEDYAALPPQQRRKRLGADRFRLHDAGHELLSAAARRVWYGVEYPHSVQFWAAAHPPTLFRAISTGEPYQVRALVLQHNNALGAYGNARQVYAALTSPRLELSVVHDLFMTPTAALADFVLPAASWMERPFLWASGRGDPVWSGQRVVAPLAERRSDYEFCRDLGRRLGQTWPETVEEVWDEWLAPLGTTFEALSTAEHFGLPGPDVHARHLDPDPAAGRPLGFGTPSGRIELASSILEQLGYDPLPAHDERADPDAARADAYPLYLMTGATRIDALHQDHRQIPSLRARHPDPTVEVDPRLAERLGVAEGDWLRIETPRGAIRQRARFVPGLGLDRVSAERWWYPERSPNEPDLAGFWESNVMAVTEDELDLCDPAYGAWPFRIGRCRVRRD